MIISDIQDRSTKAPLTSVAHLYEKGSSVGCGGFSLVKPLRLSDGKKNCPAGRNHEKPEDSIDKDVASEIQGLSKITRKPPADQDNKQLKESLDKDGASEGPKEKVWRTTFPAKLKYKLHPRF